MMSSTSKTMHSDSRMGSVACASVASEPAFSIGTLFNEAQHHNSSHRKNIHALCRLHSNWSATIEQENQFFTALANCLLMALSVKKHEDIVNRVIRFVVGFIVYSSEKEGDSLAMGESTPVTRLTANMMRMALECLDCKEKQVRVRMLQILVASINVLNELEDDIMAMFQVRVPERLFDKEAAVRVQAVHALARLQEMPLAAATSTGMSDSTNPMLIMDVFIDILQQDCSADVRKAALEQIIVSERSIDAVLTRRRDVDANVRKWFYSRKFSEIPVAMLSTERRNQILEGLFDRDPAVKKNCVEALFRHWLPNGADPISLVQMLDFRENPRATEEALNILFEGNPEWSIQKATSTADLSALEQWDSFFLWAYCKWMASKHGLEAVQDKVLSELTIIGEAARILYNEIIMYIGRGDLVMVDAVETTLLYLLETTRFADRSDEVGRRNVRDLLVELLMNMELGEGLFNVALKTLILHSADLSEFITLSSQIIIDYREIFDPSGQVGEGKVSLCESFDALPKLPVDNESNLGPTIISTELCLAAYKRALDIFNQIVERVPDSAFSFAAYPEVEQLRDLIIVPAVNSGYALIQSAGLKGLGLCGLIDFGTATSYLLLFIEFFQVSLDENCVNLALQAIDSLAPGGSLLKIITQGLYHSSLLVQSTAAEGFAKLLLNGILPIHNDDEQKARPSEAQEIENDAQPIATETPNESTIDMRKCSNAVLEGLLLFHFHPKSIANIRLKQVLSYFFPTFSFSHPSHQFALAHLSAKFLQTWATSINPTCNESIGDKSKPKSNANGGMTFAKVAAQLSYLCDPVNMLQDKQIDKNEGYVEKPSLPTPSSEPSPLDIFAINLCWEALSTHNDSLKLFVQALTKLPLSTNSSTIKQLIFLIKHLIRQQAQKATPSLDKVTLNSLDKYLTGLIKNDNIVDEASENFLAAAGISTSSTSATTATATTGLDPHLYSEMTKRLAQISCPANNPTITHKQSAAVPSKSKKSANSSLSTTGSQVLRSKPATSSLLCTNVMEDLDDILDD